MTDRARFEEIYDAYSGLILAYAARRTKDLNDAADIVAETFTVAWCRIEDVPSGQDARAWLYGVARRVVANHDRGVRRQYRLDERLAADLAVDAVDDVAGDESRDRAAIAGAFAELSEGDRELLSLVAWDEVDRDEMAVIIGCSRAALRVRLHRARERFERHLRARSIDRSGSTGYDATRWAVAALDPEEP